MADETNKSVVPGRYRHYKGGEYYVYELGTHSETEELLVAYRPLYGESALWLRPLAMFLETVEFEGKIQPRFELIGPADGSRL
ncbi:DUF1653 domain-containing protein [Zhongshania marina]|uniref:DUF1653 domain-containing protein n=1 Tax=Zhongshania marina TaxID=2304603 RepID=A0ABX9W427_9GAMM|nr:DUF1653 domain-containing protein [Zhongshania marina]